MIKRQTCRGVSVVFYMMRVEGDVLREGTPLIKQFEFAKA